MEQDVRAVEPRIGKRSGIDWSRHEHKTVISRIPVDQGGKEFVSFRMDTLKIPGTIVNSIKFINTAGVMTVTGDFGNWVFCREFEPDGRGGAGASEGYWKEKLYISSCQVVEKYDAEATESEIRRRLREAEKDGGDPAEREYLQDLLSYVNDEVDYRYKAYQLMPADMDYDDIPLEKKTHHWFIIILDAFDEICQRLKEKLISHQ
jgi:hypothetical protein